MAVGRIASQHALALPCPCVDNMLEFYFWLCSIAITRQTYPCHATPLWWLTEIACVIDVDHCGGVLEACTLSQMHQTNILQGIGS